MNITSYLEKAGITATAFAEKVGCSQSAMSLYISGKRYPRHPIARKIVKATRGKVRLDDLYPAEAEGERA